MTTTIGDAAYSKLLLHCAKYPWENVFGILLCNDDVSAEISDVIPLFHSPILASSLEVAMMLIGEHCKQTNKRICGSYYCGEDAAVPKKVVAQIAIKTKLPVFFLNVSKDKIATDEAPFQLMTPSGSDWKAAKLQVQSGAAKNFETRFLQNRATLLADFDDSLEDVSKDFRNSSLLD